MNRPASFQITARDRVIEAKLVGEWNPAIDLMYMAELSDAIQKANRKKWAMLIDMSECHIHSNNIAGAISNTLETDRRNQAFEVWVVKHADQGDFLLNFGTTRKVKIHKCFCASEGKKHLERQGFLKATSELAVSH